MKVAVKVAATSTSVSALMEEWNFLDGLFSTRVAKFCLGRLERCSVKIRAGYEISYNCPQPTPMILTLSVHPSRFPDLLTPDRMRLDPSIPANTYHDSFGNFCHVICAPARAG
jgi:hypothetical protein